MSRDQSEGDGGSDPRVTSRPIVGDGGVPSDRDGGEGRAELGNDELSERGADRAALIIALNQLGVM